MPKSQISFHINIFIIPLSLILTTGTNRLIILISFLFYSLTKMKPPKMPLLPHQQNFWLHLYQSTLPNHYVLGAYITKTSS